MKFFKKCILASSIFIIALVLSASALAETGTFNKAAVNLRSKPSSSSSSYGLVNKGATCNILDESGSWLKVKITSHTTNKTDLYGYTGWAMSEFITRGGSSSGGGSTTGKKYDDFPNSGVLRTGRVTTQSTSLNIRSIPSTSGNVVSSVKNGTTVTYYDGILPSCGSDSYTWYKITAPVQGFVASNYITNQLANRHPQTALEAFGSANLKEGCSNTYVRNLKLILNNYKSPKNFLDHHNSKFDAKTREVVKEFQSDHHKELETYEFEDVADGIVGPKTKEVLWKVYKDTLMESAFVD